MSDRLTIEAEPRTVVGKQVGALRRAGLVPGVIYGQGSVLNVQIEAKPLRRVLRVAGKTQLVNVNVAGQQYTTLVREIQQHPTRGDVQHIDFMKVDMHQKITSEAELVAVGVAAPTRAGLGEPVLILRSVGIECLPDALISEIQVDLSMITSPDHTIYVKDLQVPAGVTILADPDEALTVFEYVPTGEEEAEDYVPSADSVEVIGRGKREEEFED